MLSYNEKRDYNRMNTNCDITYRLADKETLHQGCCTSISGAGVSFMAETAIKTGWALEINISPCNQSNTPPLIAFIETLRSHPCQDGRFEIAAVIKGIKALV